MREEEDCWHMDSVCDSMNKFYDEHIKGFDLQAHFKSFTDLLDLCEGGGKLLDIGCGTAFTSTLCTNFTYHGCDLPHILAGCSMRNYPNYYYRACDFVNDNVSWIKDYDVIVANGFVDICANGLGILRKILTYAKRDVVIHRQEITRKGETHYTENPSYTGTTFHSVINRKELMSLLKEMGFKLIKETSPGFANWEDGGSSLLLRRVDYIEPENKKFESHPIRQLKNRIQQTYPLKVIIGSGDVMQPVEWICTNEEELDVQVKGDWEFLFGDKKADNIFGEHLFEHLNFPAVAAKNIFQFLKPGGKCRIAVPDGNHPDPDYIEQVRPGGTGAGADDHAHLWTRQSLTEVFEKAGFQVTPVEWWEEGEFHETKWNPDEGKVNRSRYNDERNADGPVYTSLILDCVKP